MLANVFENFRNMCLKIYKLEPAKFLLAPELAWQAALRKTKAKLILLTNIDILLMVEKSVRGGTCHSIYWYAKANKKYMKDYEKNKESSYLQYWDVNNLFWWAMSQKLSVNNFEWIKDASQFNEDFIKNYNEKGCKGYFLQVDVHYLYDFVCSISYVPERMKIKEFEKLSVNLLDKLN